MKKINIPIKYPKLFIEKIGITHKKNRWIYFTFLITLILIIITEKGDPFEISAVFLIHMSADIATIIMFQQYNNQNYKLWSIFLTLSNLLFIIIWVLAIMNTWQYQYLLTTIIFTTIWIRNNLIDNYNIKTLAWLKGPVVILSFILIYWIAIQFRWLHLTYEMYIQIIGFTLFATSLSMEHTKNRYLLSIIGLIFWTRWSAMESIRTFLDGNIEWAAISYTIFPAIILIAFLQDWNKRFKKNNDKL